jgi:hypothetical protein
LYFSLSGTTCESTPSPCGWPGIGQSIDRHDAAARSRAGSGDSFGSSGFGHTFVPPAMM